MDRAPNPCKEASKLLLILAIVVAVAEVVLAFLFLRVDLTLLGDLLLLPPSVTARRNLRRSKTEAAASPRGGVLASSFSLTCVVVLAEEDLAESLMDRLRRGRVVADADMELVLLLELVVVVVVVVGLLRGPFVGKFGLLSTLLPLPAVEDCWSCCGFIL